MIVLNSSIVTESLFSVSNTEKIFFISCIISSEMTEGTSGITFPFSSSYGAAAGSAVGSTGCAVGSSICYYKLFYFIKSI